MIRLRPALWPTLISLPIFVFSLGLGIWQMERREWKRDILDRIAVNQAAAPITLDELLRGDPLRFEYGRVKIAGSFLHDKEFYLAARSLKNKVGLQVVTPVRTDDGRVVLFDRGCVPQEQKDPAQRAQGQLAGTVELTGIVRRNQEQRQFAPDNVPDRNVWFHVDVPLMRSMAGGKPDPKLDAFFLEADAAPNPGGVPIGGQTRLDIPNDHLQYAITWFLLALALAGVYLAYHWENGRLTIAGRTKVKTMIANDPYAELERRFARLSAVNRASAILNWDRSAMMPAGASEDRADQLATLGVIAHGMISAPDMPELLARAEEGARALDPWRAANLREMRRSWVHESALPAELVEARTRATSACEMAWREARKNKDFKSLLPTLSEVLDVMRRVGEAKAAALGTSLYDALLDEFEPGGRSARIDALFAELRAFLPDLLGRVMERQKREPAAARPRRAVSRRPSSASWARS